MSKIKGGILISFFFLSLLIALLIFPGKDSILAQDVLETGRFLRIEAETFIARSLSVPQINLIDQFPGRITVAPLSSSRDYIFPDLSGEVCLDVGNCDFAPRGTPQFLARFTSDGLEDSSIRDLYGGTALTISSDGRLGIGVTSPTEMLQVEDRIRAGGDICTDLRGGVCLSELDEGIGEGIAEIRTFPDYIVEGHGTRGYLPLWDENSFVRDSALRQSGSNIGIGTWPGHTLDVSGTVRMLGFRMPVSPADGYGLMSDEDGFGTWQPVLQPEGTRADIAEVFPCLSECPSPGELVSISDNLKIEKTTTPYDERLLGIVSTDPQMTLGVREENSGVPVALIGRVPTKVSLEGGEIKAGDKLTSSSILGVAKKAPSGGRVIGMALESFSGEGIGEIKVFVNPHYQDIAKDTLRLTDKETGENYCIEIRGGELIKEKCKD